MRVGYDTIRVTRIGRAYPMPTMPQNRTAPVTPQKRKCKYCEKEFIPRKKWQIFHRSKCRFDYHNDLNAPVRVKVTVVENGDKGTNSSK